MATDVDEGVCAERTEDAAGIEIGQTEAPIYEAMVAEFGDPFQAPEGDRTAPGNKFGSDDAVDREAASSGSDNQDAMDAEPGADTPGHG